MHVFTVTVQFALVVQQEDVVREHNDAAMKVKRVRDNLVLNDVFFEDSGRRKGVLAPFLDALEHIRRLRLMPHAMHLQFKPGFERLAAESALSIN
jgi:hypothetical protein